MTVYLSQTDIRRVCGSGDYTGGCITCCYSGWKFRSDTQWMCSRDRGMFIIVSIIVITTLVIVVVLVQLLQH